MRDYYAVLEVNAGATGVQIRRAYQRLARRYSPDVNLWETDARALFEEIAEAYRILSDPTARRLYDQQGVRPRGRSDPESGARPRGRAGGDVHVPAELSFGQAVVGVEVDVAVERLAPCGSCGASGAAPGLEPTRCSHCGGLGKVWREHSRTGDTCPACEGSGAVVTAACPVCRGRGVAPSRVIVHAPLPPGMDTGSQLRIAGEGHSGPFGGPRGDLIVIARVQPDPRYARKGDNLYCEVPLSLTEAVLGARIKIRGLDGTIDLAIPPGTQSGQAFRLRGKGVRRLAGDGRGDLYVTARVEIPRSLDARTQELFRELGRLLPDRAQPDAQGSVRE